MRVFVEVHDEEFQQELRRTEHSFVYMIQTMIDVARVVGENTQPITPFLTGKLSRSFKWHIVTDNSRMKVLQVQMSALNEKTGYDYAWIQHENPNYDHSKRLKGTPYKSSRYNDDTAQWESYTSWYSGAGWHEGQWKYLETGIENSEEMAIELIEEDYLSLFYRGYIF